MQGQTEVTIGVGTLALLIAGLAQSKNRSGFGWFWLGLFFGPLALLILLFQDNLSDSKKSG